MLFGDRDVEVPVGEALLEFDEPGTLAHRRRDAHDTRVLFSAVAEPLAEDLRIGRAGGFLLEQRAARRIVGARPVPLDRVGLGRRITLALLRDHVQELRAGEHAHVAKRRDQRIHVVPVHRPDVVEAHLLEQRAGQHHALGVHFRAARKFPCRGHRAQHLLAALAQVRVHAPGHQSRKVIRQRPDVLRNRHVVVVQHDQQVDVEAACMVERLPREPGAHRAVADDGDDAPVAAGRAVRDRHAECGADRGARVADAETVGYARARDGRPGRPAA